MPDARAMIHPTTKRYVIVSPSDKPKGYKGKWSVGTVIRINPNDYRNYIAARILIPFDSAVTHGQFDPTTGKTSPQGELDTTPDPTLPSKTVKDAPIENLPEEPKKTTPAPKTPTSAPETSSPKTTTKKTVISNPLKDTIQAKKKQIEADKKTTPSSSTIDANKLAAIKAGGKK